MATAKLDQKIKIENKNYKYFQAMQVQTNVKSWRKCGRARPNFHGTMFRLNGEFNKILETNEWTERRTNRRTSMIYPLRQCRGLKTILPSPPPHH